MENGKQKAQNPAIGSGCRGRDGATCRNADRMPGLLPLCIFTFCSFVNIYKCVPELAIQGMPDRCRQFGLAKRFWQQIVAWVRQAIDVKGIAGITGHEQDF